MSMKVTNDSFGYQAPQVSVIIIISEGLLCGSMRFGETTDLQTDDLGDIWD